MAADLGHRFSTTLKHIFVPETRDQPSDAESDNHASTTTISSSEDADATGGDRDGGASQSEPVDVPGASSKPGAGSGSRKWLKGSPGSPILSKSPPSDSKTTSGGEEADQDPGGHEKRKSLWSTLADKLGMDITRVTLPVWLSEPITSLQRAFECFECIELVDKANEADDPKMALAYIAAFLVSGYASTSDRAAKCFNPMLGETFEYIHSKNNSRFFYEQVCHHPPVIGTRGEGEHFVLDQDSTIKTKFMGNYIEIFTLGDTAITLKKSGHSFSYTVPNTVANNLIFGHLWLDIHGEANIKNHTTKESCVLKFQKCGWFGVGKFEVHGVILDADGKETDWHLDGMRNSHLDLIRPNEEPFRLWDRVKEEVVETRFKFTPWLTSLNAMDDEQKAVICCTDSRLRPDRIGLEQHKTGVAVEEKSRLEVAQRRDRKARGGDENWVPRWFKQIHHPHVDREFWMYQGGYWEAREQREQQYRAGEPVIENKGPVSNLACDYRCDDQ